MTAKKRRKKVPKGTSEYQAAWILDSDDDEDGWEEYNEEEGDDMDADQDGEEQGKEIDRDDDSAEEEEELEELEDFSVAGDDMEEVDMDAAEQYNSFISLNLLLMVFLVSFLNFHIKTKGNDKGCNRRVLKPLSGQTRCKRLHT